MIKLYNGILMVKPYALFFQALANPVRSQIILLLSRKKLGMSVSEICDKLGLEQTGVSHNLRCLTFCGLITSIREGKSRIYSVNQETILPLISLVDKHLEKYGSNLYDCDVLER